MNINKYNNYKPNSSHEAWRDHNFYRLNLMQLRFYVILVTPHSVSFSFLY